ncbi:hypothetical protein SK431_24685, partial [Escherichia coli]|nr:hypothetical protein [Escherichia coli]
RFAADSPEQKLTLCDDVAGLSQAGEFPFNPDTSAGAETECVSMFRYEAHVAVCGGQSGAEADAVRRCGGAVTGGRASV